MESAEKIAGKAFEVLEGLGGTVGETARDLWPHAVRYVWAAGIAQMVFAAIFGIVLGTIFIVLHRKIGKWEVPKEEWRRFEGMKPTGLVGTLALFAVSTGVCLWLFTTGLIQTLEPTGATVKMIIEGIAK